MVIRVNKTEHYKRAFKFNLNGSFKQAAKKCFFHKQNKKS